MTTVSLLLISISHITSIPENILLEFTAEWCGPCQQMSPIVSRLQRKGYPIQTIDVDRQQALTKEFSVKAMPTFVVIRNGKEAERFVGLLSEDQLKSLAGRVSGKIGVRAVDVNQHKQDHSRATPIPKPKPNLAQSLVQRTKAALTPQINLPFFGRKTPEVASNTDPSRVVRAKIDDDRQLVRTTAAVDPGDYCARIRVVDENVINFGSGTLIDSQPGRTLILTCGHIFRDINDGSKIEVEVFSAAESKMYPGKLVKFDMDADVGLISVTSWQEFPVCKIATDTSHIMSGSHVFSIGCSRGEPPTRQQLRVTALNRYLGPDNIECTGLPVQGRSGGGLFDAHGQVIGVCNAADPKDHRGLYCGPVAIKTFLKQCGLSALYQSNHQEFAELNEHAQPSKLPLAGSNRIPASRNFQSEHANASAAIPTESRPKSERNSKTLPAVDTVTAAVPETITNSATVRSALTKDKTAEVVCIIRPLADPRGASRIVIINRASAKFLAELTGEIEAQAQLTTMSVVNKQIKPTIHAAMEQTETVDLLNRTALYARRAQRHQAAGRANFTAEPSKQNDPMRYRRSAHTR